MSIPELWSLWEIMKQFEAGKLMKAINGLATLEQLIEGHPPPQDFRVGLEEHGFMKSFVQDSVSELSRLKFKLALQSARQMKEEFERTKENHGQMPNGDAFVSWDWKRIQTFKHFAEQTRGRVVDYLAATTCLILGDDDQDYWRPSEPLFGVEVETAFPSASDEIAEAGKCRAVGRWTACVMHLMRALEPSLLALQSEVGVAVSKDQWNGIIDQIEAKIKLKNKSNSPKGDEQWFSEAATQFKWIKNAWRNYAMHLHERYDEERAAEIFNSTRSLMRHLASRLSE